MGHRSCFVANAQALYYLLHLYENYLLAFFLVIFSIHHVMPTLIMTMKTAYGVKRPAETVVNCVPRAKLAGAPPTDSWVQMSFLTFRLTCLSDLSY